MTTILLTGATGLVGSSLVTLLKKRGYRVLYLVRSSGRLDAEARVRQMFGDISPEDMVLKGEVTRPLAGISHSLVTQLKGKIDKVVHSAASVKFDQALAEETFSINLGGTKNLLELAGKLNIPEFHFVSTAYVAGNANAFSEDDFDIGQQTRNPYESSKKQAEGLVRSWSEGKFSIYRPSVIVGNSETGLTPTFDGYYGFFIHFWRLLKTLQGKWSEMSEKYIEQGIQFRDGFLELPLRLDCSFTSTINLVAINWVTNCLDELISLNADNQTYHLVHPDPQKVQWVIETSLAILGIRGLKYTEEKGGNSQSQLVKRLQSAFDRAYQRYRPYSSHEACFICHNLPHTLGGKCRLLPAIDKHFLTKLLNYAKRVDFGRKMQATEVEIN